MVFRMGKNDILYLILACAFLILLKDQLLANSAQNSNENSPPQATTRQIIFKPGDAVRIMIYPDTTSFLHGTYPIDGEGYVYLPITGRVKVSQMNEEQLVNFLKTSYTQYFRIPNIQVRNLMRVSVLGGFNRPGMYYVDSDETLWHLLRLAGGTADGEGLADLKWERDNEVIEENLISMLESGKSLRQLGFRSGDQIWVKRPDQPTFWDRAVQIGTLATATATLMTIYLTFYAR